MGGIIFRWHKGKRRPRNGRLVLWVRSCGAGGTALMPYGEMKGYIKKDQKVDDRRWAGR
jgi:hypothetical protein